MLPHCAPPLQESRSGREGHRQVGRWDHVTSFSGTGL